jgi:hypothetical protein
VPRVVAIFGVQGWRWAWARDVRALVLALDADATGAQAWRTLARQAALRGKRVAMLPAAAYGGAKDASAAWGAGVLRSVAWATDGAHGDEEITRAADRRESGEERLAIMMYDGQRPYATAACWAGAVLPESTSAARET